MQETQGTILLLGDAAIDSLLFQTNEAEIFKSYFNLYVSSTLAGFFLL
jgi:hypothetical protein